MNYIALQQLHSSFHSGGWHALQQMLVVGFLTAVIWSSRDVARSQEQTDLTRRTKQDLSFSKSLANHSHHKPSKKFLPVKNETRWNRVKEKGDKNSLAFSPLPELRSVSIDVTSPMHRLTVFFYNHHDPYILFDDLGINVWLHDLNFLWELERC
jgi:hypothetical protein